MPVALNLEILRQKMPLSAANSFSSANATVKTKQKILWRILQFTVLTQSEPPITVRETSAGITAAGMKDFRVAFVKIIQYLYNFKSPAGHAANAGGLNWVKLSKVALLSRAWQ